MILNLTKRNNFKARDTMIGGIYGCKFYGPSFGNGEFYTREPLLGKDKVTSSVDQNGFKIGGEVG
jgi:hypothetical protein